MVTRASPEIFGDMAGRELRPSSSTHGWAKSWRDTVYDFVHYHSQIHEVTGVARGTAKIECSGLKGPCCRSRRATCGLPAETGHRLIDGSRNFLVVGAYPKDGTYTC
jgi:uncharacterized protein YjlB